MLNAPNSRRDFLETTLLGALALTATAIAPSPAASGGAIAPERPNILLIMTDDQGWGDVRSHGNRLIDTPVMDALAASGVRFDRFFVSPVCAPTRASLLSGRYHLRTGVHGVTRGFETMRSEEVTIAEILKKEGYATGCFGKWHNGAHFPCDPNGQGFDEFFGFCGGHWNNYFDTTLQHNDRMVKTKGYIADVVTDAAIQFMEQNRDIPFFCYVPYNPPHSPFQVPDNYYDKYKNRGLDDELACVYAMCENIDDNMGRLLRKLDSLRLRDKTIIIFLTDNGPNTDRFNGGMRGRKGSVHEGGIRVPCFVNWQGHIPEGKTIPYIASHIDILPTIVEFCGLPEPETLPLDGKSLVPLIKGENADWQDRMIFTHWAGRGSVRTQRFRLTLEGEKAELFDMVLDPAETEDVSARHPDIFNSLRNAYAGWHREAASDGFEPVPIALGYDERQVVELPGHEGFLAPAGGKGIDYKGASGWANDYITNWTSVGSFVYWEVDVVSSGTYEFALKYACSAGDTGARICLEIGNEGIESVLERAHHPRQIPSPDRVPRKEVYEWEWAEHYMGRLTLSKGKTRLAVKAKEIKGRQVMDLKSVLIKKVF